ncbi:PucR family transcriptional regulator [Nocardia mexicana]|uniref:PucR-like helix-turn-helix protein n=1 Tax=Nocardia mexicana TaxID=279262 RepID=A0A370HFG8_9NOCA|nr:helix-turn-helix domain-containing protein [Nocardia mexicana]RDI55988.1 PucR-like helix-turn-helix protein [Nocardia mexicana]
MTSTHSIPAGLVAEEPPPTGNALFAVMGDCLELSICMLDGRARPEQLRRLEREAARWAREGIPMVTVLRLVHDGFRLGIELTGAAIEPAADHLRAVDTDLVLGLLNTVTATVARAYAPQLHTVTHRHAVRQALAAALVDGRPTSTLARQNGIEIAREYWILALLLPPAPAAIGTEPRRRAEGALPRLRVALAECFAGAALPVLSPDGGTILLPTAVADDDSLDALVNELSCAAEVPVTAAVMRSVTDDIPAGVDRAHELLDLVHRLGLVGGLHRFADLALEYQLTRPGPALDVLSSLLAPLDNQPDLLTTLKHHFANDLSRKRTARMLHLHPNTVDYRLHRIAQLTGLDAGRPEGLWYLRSALIARSHQTNPPAPSRRRRVAPKPPAHE